MLVDICAKCKIVVIFQAMPPRHKVCLDRVIKYICWSFFVRYGIIQHMSSVQGVTTG